VPSRKACRVALAGLLLLSGCTAMDDQGARRRPIDPSKRIEGRDAALVASHVGALELLALAAPAEQSKLAEDARRLSAADPSISNRLRYALMVGLPGHVASDPIVARDELASLLAAPEMLPPAEIALANIMLQEVNARIALASDNQRLASNSANEENLLVQTLTRRLQGQMTENARLRQELEAALAKLEAVAILERNSAERHLAPDKSPP